MTDTLDTELPAQVRRNIYAFFSEFFGNGRSAELLAFWPDIYGAVFGTEKDPAPLEAGSVLEAAYAKLFYGVGEATVPLSESSYRNEKSLTCQETNRELLRFYAENGSLMPGREYEADTLSCELAFAAKIAGSNEAALQTLLKAHLAPFAGAVEGAVRAAAPASSLLEVLETLNAFLRAELKGEA
jgi:TorA maturation chaperone TorD